MSFHLAVHTEKGRRTVIRRQDHESDESINKRAASCLSSWQQAEPEIRFFLEKTPLHDSWSWR